jgi:hypothetical protein
LIGLDMSAAVPTTVGPTMLPDKYVPLASVTVDYHRHMPATAEFAYVLAGRYPETNIAADLSLFRVDDAMNAAPVVSLTKAAGCPEGLAVDDYAVGADDQLFFAVRCGPKRPYLVHVDAKAMQIRLLGLEVSSNDESYELAPPAYLVDSYIRPSFSVLADGNVVYVHRGELSDPGGGDPSGSEAVLFRLDATTGKSVAIVRGRWLPKHSAELTQNKRLVCWEGYGSPVRCIRKSDPAPATPFQLFPEVSGGTGSCLVPSAHDFGGGVVAMLLTDDSLYVAHWPLGPSALATSAQVEVARVTLPTFE